MTSKERVKAAIHFKRPDKLPVWFDSVGHSDITNCMLCQLGGADTDEKFVYDEWKCGWRKSEVDNMGLITEYPIEEWDMFDDYKFPDTDDPKIFERVDAAFVGNGDKYMLISTFLFIFERFHALRGFENCMMDLYIERERSEDLADKLADYFIEVIDKIVKRYPGRIGGVKFSDDWGTETSLFINPVLWKEFFKPRYKKVFDACKKLGLDIWLHSCGKVNSIIGELIDIGLDVINLQQPTLLGIKEVGDEFAGRICFLSLCDIQKTLPFKGEEEIRREAKMLLDCWGTLDGGFILGDYGDGKAIQIQEWKRKCMYDAFISNDRWSENKLLNKIRRLTL